MSADRGESDVPRRLPEAARQRSRWAHAPKTAGRPAETWAQSPVRRAPGRKAPYRGDAVHRHGGTTVLADPSKRRCPADRSGRLKVKKPQPIVSRDLPPGIAPPPPTAGGLLWPEVDRSSAPCDRSWYAAAWSASMARPQSLDRLLGSAMSGGRPLPERKRPPVTVFRNPESLVTRSESTFLPSESSPSGSESPQRKSSRFKFTCPQVDLLHPAPFRAPRQTVLPP